MRIYIKTFGCTANRADSQKMRRFLKRQGHTFTETPESADIIVVNTCTVTENTERKILKYLRSVSTSGKRLVVAGCLPAARQETLRGIECSVVIPSTLRDITVIVGEGHINGEADSLLFDDVTGIVSISQGCAGNCSYCIVKKARGELESRPIPEIVEEVESLISQGAKEIQLSSQDMSAYGLDTGKRLPELLDAITCIEGDYMVRVGMMNPFTVIDIVDEVVESC